MAEPHVVAALKDKRAELAGIIADLEKRISGHRAGLVHLDVTSRRMSRRTPKRPGSGQKPSADATRGSARARCARLVTASCARRSGR